MMRFLGIDYGTKRIGLAVADDQANLAVGVSTVSSGRSLIDNIQAVKTVGEDYGVDAFVVGLPLNMDDTESKQAKLTRAFGDKLAQLSGKTVHYFDERLSSVTADELLRPAELTRKKRKAVQDAVAAQVILQGFLDAHDNECFVTP